MSTAPDPPSPPSPQQRIRWIGGVIRPRGFRHRGTPMQLAAWITSAGSIIDVAIVSGQGPALLRRMLDEQLQRCKTDKRPTEITIWPSVKAAFRDVSFPTVEVRKDEFLKVVVEDQCSYGRLPDGAPVRAG